MAQKDIVRRGDLILKKCHFEMGEAYWGIREVSRKWGLTGVSTVLIHQTRIPLHVSFDRYFGIDIVGEGREAGGRKLLEMQK